MDDLKKVIIELSGSNNQLQMQNTKPQTLETILKDYIKLDKSFRLKHESLKTLYRAYLQLYNKYKEQNSGGVPEENARHQNMLKTIHSEMRDNNTNLYRERLLILKKIKSVPDMCPIKKEKICGKLLAIFKAPAISDYTPAPIAVPEADVDDSRAVNVNELDEAYLSKHNELMSVYKAYQNLFKKTLGYRDALDEYKKLNTGSKITVGQMNKMIDDQRFVMSMIDKMQDELVDRKIINNTEKVPVVPVANNPSNIGFFNDNARTQIKHIISRDVNITPSAKNSIEKLLTNSGQMHQQNVATMPMPEHSMCNDEFCRSGGKIIILKRAHRS